MRFKQFFSLSEADAMGAGALPMADPMGGGAPPMGGAMGGMPPAGGMGGDPMAGGMGAPPGAAPPMSSSEPPVIPKHADVWSILDSILNHKPVMHDKKLAQEKQQKAQQPDPSAAPPMPPPAGAPGQPPMGTPQPTAPAPGGSALLA